MEILNEGMGVAMIMFSWSGRSMCFDFKAAEVFECRVKRVGNRKSPRDWD
jgi:hypothetical protein